MARERSELVREEKNLMVHFTEAHKRGDEKSKAEIMNRLQRNAHERGFRR